MEKLQKNKQLDLENVHTYALRDECGFCVGCLFIPGAGAIAIATVAFLG